jgi:hypothetical protein
VTGALSHIRSTTEVEWLPGDRDPEHDGQHAGTDLDGELATPGEVEDVVDGHRDGDRTGDGEHLPAIGDS